MGNKCVLDDGDNGEGSVCGRPVPSSVCTVSRPSHREGCMEEVRIFKACACFLVGKEGKNT